MRDELQHLWFRLAADKKKFGAMCALLAVGLLLWGRLILLENVARSGYAKPGGDKAADGAATKPDAAGESKGDNRPSKVEAPLVLVTTRADLKRNVFQAPPELLAQTSQKVATPPDDPKSPVDTPEEMDAQALEQARVERVVKESEKLRLNSVVLGQQPAAIVNGLLLRAGESIEGFALETILERSVILVKDGVRVELNMDAPGL